MNIIFSLPMDIYKNRRLVAKLAKNDFKTRYAGSYLGIVWAFIQPVITILVYWFVFSVGFRSGAGESGRFLLFLYLVAGIVPWFFFLGCADRGDKFSGTESCICNRNGWR